jgi:flagellar hook-associated protein 1 FlgK
MSEFSGILNIGRMALAANQSAIAVTAQNQANINTPGYSRQVPVFVASHQGTSATGPIGTGVEIGEVRRVVDRFVESQLLGGQSSLGGYQVERRVLGQLESLVSSSQGAGLQEALNHFFSAVHDLANNPQGATERLVLLSRSRSLAQQFSSISRQMQSMRADLNGDVLGTVDSVNALADRIAGLNRTIGHAEAGGAQANDLRDERGRLLQELSEQISISAIDGDGGQVTVTIAGGKPLVLGGQAFAIRGAADPLNSAFANIQFVSAGGTATDVTASLAGGRLKSLLDLRDGTVPGVMDQLDDLASGIITEFNAQHRLGFDLNGAVGGDFFAPTGVGARAAGTMAVALTDTDLVAAASAAGAPGDNGNALLLGRLQHVSVASLGSTSFQDFYSSLVGVVGAESQAAGWNLVAQESIMAQLSEQRESVSGVSLDEELTNMMKFQRAYQAAAQLITTADEMMQTILNLKR